MKKTVALIFTILSALLILDSLNAGQALLMFVLAGQVPGTSIIISASVMLQAYLVLIGFVCARLFIAALNSLSAQRLKRQTA